MTTKTDYDICVIGGGAAGLVVAAGAATMGAKVILVEKHRLGGDCLYTGCVPSKALLHTAKVAQTVRQAERFGIKAKLSDIKLTKTLAYVQSVIAGIEPHDSPERFRELGVEVVFDRGQFIDTATLALSKRTIRARKFVIATGSRTFIPAIDGIDSTPYLTNEQIFSVTENIKRLIVIGAGAIGIELAQAFRRLGSEVVVINHGPAILNREDQDLVKVVKQQLQQEGVEFYLERSVSAVSQVRGNIQVHLTKKSGELETVTGSHLLVATGRTANVEQLGLDRAAVEVDKRGIKVDKRLRTTNKRIYACGDVSGSYMFTHVAEHQAGVVLRNALFHLPAKVEERVVPWCTFTDPELARVGLSETESIAQNINHKVYHFPFHDIDRARTDGVTEGFIKVITNKKGGLLGAAIVGSQAGELIHEYALAMNKGLKLAELSGLIHIYPTLSQINRRVADTFLKQKLTPRSRRWLKRLFRLRGN